MFSSPPGLFVCKLFSDSSIINASYRYAYNICHYECLSVVKIYLIPFLEKNNLVYQLKFDFRLNCSLTIS